MFVDSNYISNTINFYEKNTESYIQRTINIDLNPSYKKFLKYIPSNGSILDAGCGSGRDSLFFASKGYKVTAFDASKKMAQHAYKYKKFEVYHLKFSDMNFKTNFDGIWSSASLLHLNYSDLDKIINKMIIFLKPKGIWFISFKHGKSKLIKEGRFFNNFTKKSLANYLSKFDKLKILDIWVSSSHEVGNENEWVQVILKKI